MRKITRLGLGLAIVAASVTVPSASFGHAEVVSASPAPGSSIDAGVTDIDITFDEALMQSVDSQGSALEITDNTTGEVDYVDCVYVDGAHLYAKAALFNDGPVTLTWRTVADDGHAISDSYTFNVSNPKGEALTDTSNFCPAGHTYATTDWVNPKVMKEDAVATPAAKKSSDSGLLIGLGMGVVVIFLFALLGAIQTRRRWAKEDAAGKKKK